MLIEPDPEEGPAYYWMITGTWTRHGHAKTRTCSGVIDTYLGEPYAEVADRALMAFQGQVGYDRDDLVVLMLHLAPNDLPTSMRIEEEQ